MSRLSPTKETVRAVAIRSKNKCAFPGCDHLLMNEEGTFIAELCHIEAAEPGGQRYNSAQSPEDRRSASNLFFMCHAHHKETDDEIKYTVSRLREIKSTHEALPEVIYNQELLLQAIEKVSLEQSRIQQILLTIGDIPGAFKNYPINGPELAESWTPETGRFYESRTGEKGKFRYMMQDGWLHIEQTLEDGAVGYYEINEEGSTRETKLPYPISEYRVVIPDELILSKKRIRSECGTHAVETTLKWSKGTVTEHFIGTTFNGVECSARCAINQVERTISIVV